MVSWWTHNRLSWCANTSRIVAGSDTRQAIIQLEVFITITASNSELIVLKEKEREREIHCNTMATTWSIRQV